jgi:predicted acyltransferase
MTATLAPPATASTSVFRYAPPSRPSDISTPLEPPVATDGREAYIDAFRGFVMLCLISRGFGVIELKNVAWAAPLVRVFDHALWAGMTPWDMIQPWFMFIVGVAMPFAFAKRAAAGASWGSQFGHALKRSFMLLLWAHIAMSVSGGKPVLELINVLAQIALSYLIAFFVLGRHWTVQAAVAVGMLVVHTALHVLWRPEGVTGPWDKEANVGWYLDKLILHKNWSGGYATINFIPCAFNTIAGVMAGELLRRTYRTPAREPSGSAAGSADAGSFVPGSPLAYFSGTGSPARSTIARNALILLATGAALIALGLILSLWMPIIKRIWTGSFALVSTGISLLTLLAFYLVHRKWPNVRWSLFIVIGANPIFLYLVQIIFGGQLRRIVNTYTEWLAWRIEASRGWTEKALEPAVASWVAFANAWGALLILIAVAYWLYRRKIFLRV